MQCQILAQALGLPFRVVTLGPHFSPPVQWPDTTGLRLILSFGNAVQAACALRASCAVRPLIVQIGRPSHIPITDLNLIIPLPQDDYPSGPNILKVAWPFNGASLTPEAESSDCKRNAGTIVVCGGASRQFRMGQAEIQRLFCFGSTLAKANKEALQIITSPRTPPDLVRWMREQAWVYGGCLHPFKPGEELFRMFLQTGNRFVVTADSASMLAEAWRTCAPVWLFPLPPHRTMTSRLERGVDSLGFRTLRHWFIKRGILGSGTSFTQWHRTLIRRGDIRCASASLSAQDLRWSPVHHRVDNDLIRCRHQILALPGLLPAGD